MLKQLEEVYEYISLQNFYRLKLIESYGTGIQRILEGYHGTTCPQFLTEASSFVTILPNTHYITENAASSIKNDSEHLVLQMFNTQNEITVTGNARSTRYLLNSKT